MGDKKAGTEGLREMGEEFAAVVAHLVSKMEYHMEDNDHEEVFPVSALTEDENGIFSMSTDQMDQMDRDFGDVSCGLLTMLHQSGEWNDDNGAGNGTYVLAGKRIGLVITTWTPEYCDDESDGTAEIKVYGARTERELSTFMERLAGEEDKSKLAEEGRDFGDALGFFGERAEEEDMRRLAAVILARGGKAALALTEALTSVAAAEDKPKGSVRRRSK